MLKFQWNALRRGDSVFVHDATDDEFALMPGEVMVVDTVVGSTNVLAVRVDEGAQVVRPARLTVHLDPLAPNDDCWRCAVATAAVPGASPAPTLAA